MQYYAPDYELDVRPSNMDNANSQDYLQKIKIQVIENLRQTVHAPSVQQQDVPRDLEGFNDEADAEMDDADEDDNPDRRHTKRRRDQYIEKDGELSESEDEDDEAETNGARTPRNGVKRRRNIMDYQNPLAAADDDSNAGPSGAVSARSGRSQANGIDHSDVGDDSEAADDEDEDVEMIDGHPADDSTNGITAQEATPPDSPEQVVGEVIASSHVVTETGNNVADEGDIADDDKQEGREERELEDVEAEKATEVVERRDGS